METIQEPATSLPREEQELLNTIATIIVEITMNIRLNERPDRFKPQPGSLNSASA